MTINKLQLSHPTTLTPQELVEYFCIPKKIETWLARGSAACTERPDKRAIEIHVMQDHYLEWVLPSHLMVDKPSKFSFHQIHFELTGPLVSVVEVTLEQQKSATQIHISISGPFDHELKEDILRDWESLTHLFPVEGK